MDTPGVDVPGEHQGSVGSSRAPQLQSPGEQQSSPPVPASIPFLHRCLLFVHSKAAQHQFQAQVGPFPAQGVPEEITRCFRISLCAPHSACPLQPGFSPISLLCACLAPQSSVSQPGDPKFHSEQGTPAARGALNQGQCCWHSDLPHLPCPVLGVSSDLPTSCAHEDELRGAGQAGCTSRGCSGPALASHTQLMPAGTGLPGSGCCPQTLQTPRAPEEALAGDPSAGIVLC